ncbi:hypothetical protein QOT17_015196 [Balamuthia mandrillaris]
MKDEEGEGHSSPKRKKLFHKKVSRACLLCKKAHAACDIQRPCARCVCLGKANECTDALPKKRGRKPKLLPHHNSSFYNVITASNPQSTTATTNHHLDDLVVHSDGGEDFGHQPPTTKPSAGEEASPYSSSSSPLSLSSFSSSATHLLSSSQTAPPTLPPHQQQPSLPSSSVGIPRQQSSYSTSSPSFVNSTTPLNGNNRSSSPQHFGGGGEEDEEEEDDLPPKKSRKTLQRNRSRSSGKSKLKPTNVARQDSGGEPVAVLSQHAASQHSFPQSLSSSGPQRTSPPPSSNYQVYASGAPVDRSYSPSGDSLSPPPSAHRQYYRHQQRPSDHSLLDLESDSAFHTSSMPQPSASISGSEYGATDHSATSPLTPFSFPTSHPPPPPQPQHQHRHQQHHQHYAYQQQQQRGGGEQNFLMKKERTGSPPPHAMVAGMPSIGSASAGQASSTSAGAIAIAASDTSVDSLPFSATPSPAAILSRHNLSTTTGSGIEELPNSHKSDLLSSLLREIRHFKNTNRELTELVAQLRSSHLSLKLAFEELQREQRRCQWELENMRKEQLIANERFSIQSRHYQPSSSPSTSSSMATPSAPSALPAPSQAAQTTPTEYALSSAAGSLLDTPLSFSSTSSFTSSSSPSSVIDAELRFPFSYAQHHNDLPAPSNSSEHRVTPSTTSSVPIFSVSDSNKPFGIFKKGRNDGVLIAANDAFCKLFHFTLSEILGLSWKTFVAPQSFELCKQLITPILSSKYSGSSPIITKTVTYKTKDGLYFDALTNHQLYYDDSGMASWSVMSFERVLEQHGTVPTKHSSQQQQQIPYSESELDAGGSQHQREALSPTTFLCAFERGSSPPSPQALDLYPNHSSPLMIDTDVITTSSSTSTESSVLRQAALSSQSQSLQMHPLLHGSGSAPQMRLRNPSLHSAQTALSEELFGGMATMSNSGSSPAMLGLSSSETAVGPVNHVSIASSSGNNALLSVREQQRFTQDESVPSRGRRGDGGEELSQSTGRSSGFRP